MSFLYTYHPSWIILFLIIAFLYAFVLYKKETLLEDVSKKIKILLASFRFLFVFIILILLLGIVFETSIEIKEKPIVFIAHDDSESIIQTKDSGFYQKKYIDDLNALASDLKNSFEIITYSFSDKVKEGLSYEYNGKTTDISKVINQIYDQYSNRNVGAVILSTDGVFNTGSNPIYSIARKNYIPFYTIGLGDTNKIKDIKIESIYNNEIAFLGNQFPVEVTLSHYDFKGKKVQVDILDGDKKIAQQTVDFSLESEQKRLSFLIQANKPGFKRYQVKISELQGEYTFKNNSMFFYVEVIDGRQKILLAYSSPHPDISSVHYVVENNKNYEIDVKYISEINEIDKYDLIILHNYSEKNSSIEKALENGEKPFLIFVGPGSNFNLLSSKKIGFSGSGNKTEDIQFSANGNFSTIIYPGSVIKLLSEAPPLFSPFGSMQYSSSVDILAHQKIGNIKLEQPLIYFTEKNNSKIGVFMGEGVFRWRMFDQLKNNSTESFELFFTKIISYLALKESKNPFRVIIKNEYVENENIVVKAELYNSSFDIVNEPDVKFVIQNSDKKTFEYTFYRSGNSYQLDIGKLPQGIYDWEASTVYSGKKYEAKGSFVVKEVKIELINITANHRLLNNIAENTNGGFYLPNQLEKLKNDLSNKEDIVTVAYKEKSFDDLIDKKWLFLLIIIFVATEWFIRKYLGAY